MGTGATLLVELLTEELPPKALARLDQAFAAGLRNGLSERGFLSTTSTTHSHATPRRLAVQISDVLIRSPDTPQREKVLPIAVALDANGQPTMPFRKAMARRGREALVDLWPHAVDGSDRLAKESDGKSESIFLYTVAKGSELQVGLQGALEETIEGLPIPKVMTYQRPDGSDQKFVRPAHRLVALHGMDVVPVRALGLDAGRITEGHRFQGEREITLRTADEYASVLRERGKVIAGFGERRAAIEEALAAEAAKLDADLQPDPVYQALLDEVTALTENPAVYVGRFEHEFLEVPQECLILTMRTNQKYFPLFDGEGRLRQEFLIVSNMRLADPSRVITGNERVVRPRLADAKFFFDQDRKVRLADRTARLANVVYHNRLGSQQQRIERLQRLSARLASLVGADPALAQHAAGLAKADLVTDMVGEFPELQGIMGRYYALHDGEPMEVADAIEQHYWPRFAGDRLPEGRIAICVALADRLDTLVGIYGIGLVPTGDKDAYGLRRHALGVLRIAIEHGLPLDLPDVLALAKANFFHGLLAETTVADLHGFILERLRGMQREQGYTANEVEAVLAQMPRRVDQVPARLAAVREFGALPEAEALAAANKRIQNILKKADAVGASVDEALFAEDAERALHRAVAACAPGIDADLAAGRYTAALKALAALGGTVDTFFDKVLVNAEDPAVRANRLALLDRLDRLMNQVADISKLAA